MDLFLYAALALLALLACCDLFVGVSNDAVNFLNSAVGSRTAPFWVIMAVASAGVLLGATFSSGMMEIAKTGVFVPEHLTFNDVMVVFVAVVVTDVLLLNTFNSLGLPTSTTVSILFELLGGAGALACWKVWSQGAPITDLGLYINSGKALVMILGILVSVVVAFISGFVIQYLTRIVFSFRYETVYRRAGGIFGGLCLSAILYFLIMKGAKGASFMRPEWLAWMNENSGLILGVTFCFFSGLFQAAISWKKANIFPVIILSGTFALAFAFAGNDLVNFVGVPIAALDSFNIYREASAAGPVDPATFTMGALRNVEKTPTVLLALSGLVMCFTLWFSKKAHRVIRTSVNLSSSSRGGKEQFGSSLPARLVVRGALHTNELIHQILPASLFRALDTRFVPKAAEPGKPELPFDELRASVNLVLAAALIASATSLKLPLSTTYVTFMVAMGSSLADRAWDRESAVYRVSGVLTVVSGWFLTAFTAAAACAIVSALFLWLGHWAMIAGMVIALCIIIRSNLLPSAEEERLEAVAQVTDRGDRTSVRELLTQSIDENLDETLELFSKSLQAFVREDIRELRELKARGVDFFERVSLGRGEYYRMSHEPVLSSGDRDARCFYYRAFTSMKEVSHALMGELGVAENYVANCHSPFKGRMLDNVILLAKDMELLRTRFSASRCTKLLSRLEDAQSDFMTQLSEEPISLRKSELYLGFLLFTREMLNRYMMVKLLQAELNGPQSTSATAASPEATAPSANTVAEKQSGTA